jgi:UDP-N-acetylglucosamine diphosphorylase / glucose-1-phosphate thymidylyltransferase / UDP-N-acetylgalactosamine diphosphorylase / glucosamine-1-phosphate N-acetyltransferase / galactosamine-1-phosphate N-acetyltransferase
MKAVVLAAGLGKRLAAITADKPKVLVKVGNKTLIEHNLAKLRNLGFTQIALVIGYKGEMVQETVGDSVAYYEQKERLGTAHAFMQAREFIDDPFFLGLNGDMFFTDPLTDFVKLKPPAIAVYKVEDSSRYGIFEIKSGKVISVREKTGQMVPGFINAGVYLFPKGIFSYIEKTPLSSRKEYEVTDTIQMMINEGFNFTAYELQGFWKDIAYASDIEEAQEAIKRAKIKQ